MNHADRFTDELQAICVEKLGMFPNIGSGRDYLSKGVLEFPQESYMIYYRVRDETIEIVRIMHGSVDVEISFADKQ